VRQERASASVRAGVEQALAFYSAPTVPIRNSDARDGTASLPYRTSWDDAPAAGLLGDGGLGERERSGRDVTRTKKKPSPGKSMTAGSVADAVPLLPDRLSSLAGYVIERVLNEGTEPGGFVVGASCPARRRMGDT